MPERKRILLVDDHPIVRDGLAQLINQCTDLSVCAEAGDAAEAVQALDQFEPDLAVVDISLRGTDGLELIKQAKARRPGLVILVLSMHSEELYAERVLRAGARGYIMKQEATTGVLTAIRQVLAGEVYLSPAMQARLLQRVLREEGQGRNAPLDCLSDRELAILQLMGRGRSTREIAEELSVSIKTVESHRDRIKRKLALRSGTQLMEYAVRWAQSDVP